MLLLTVGGASVVVANYQPFRPGYFQYDVPSVATSATTINWVGMPPNLRAIRVPSHEGLTFTYRFSIWNHGPVPVTIERFGIPLSEQRGSWEIITPIAIMPNANMISPTWEPVRPVTLASRQQIGVEVRVTVTHCAGVGALTQWNQLPITFSVYGIERHVLAPTNVQINLLGTEPGCRG